MVGVAPLRSQRRCPFGLVEQVHDFLLQPKRRYERRILQRKNQKLKLKTPLTNVKKCVCENADAMNVQENENDAVITGDFMLGVHTCVGNASEKMSSCSAKTTKLILFATESLRFFCASHTGRDQCRWGGPGRAVTPPGRAAGFGLSCHSGD